MCPVSPLEPPQHVRSTFGLRDVEPVPLGADWDGGWRCGDVVLALAEPALRRGGSGASSLPPSSAAAARLGWSITKFNRKLDNVCQKLGRAGVRGLHGDAGKLASGRRGRLVEYALAVRLVTPEDLSLLEQHSPG